MTSEEHGHVSLRARPRSDPQHQIVHLAFGRVAASLRRAGRKRSARASDAMIAATALANGLPLYTCNPAHFAGIDGLDVIAVTVPDA